MTEEVPPREPQEAVSRLELSAHMKVRPGQLEGFKQQVAEIIRLAQTDTRTLRFDWFLSQDETECELREEYVDSEGFMEHRAHIAAAGQRLFAEFAADHRVAVYGEPSAALFEIVDRGSMGQTVTWFRFLQGLDREPTSFRTLTARPGVTVPLELGAHLTVRPEQADGFRRQVAELLRLTREQDTRTLRYDWFLSRDGTKCNVREAYVDVQGLVEHNAHVVQARGTLFERFADNHFMTVYGEATQQLRDLFKTTHMEEHMKLFTLLGGLDAGTIASAVATRAI
jgi:quinol monooxygenase YgiN